MILKPSEIRFWQEVLIAKINSYRGYDVDDSVRAADVAVLRLRERLEAQEQLPAQPYREPKYNATAQIKHPSPDDQIRSALNNFEKIYNSPSTCGCVNGCKAWNCKNL